MKTEFKASFAKDLKSVKSKDVKRHVKDTIEEIERAQSIRDVAGVKKLRGAGD